MRMARATGDRSAVSGCSDADDREVDRSARIENEPPFGVSARLAPEGQVLETPHGFGAVRLDGGKLHVRAANRAFHRGHLKAFPAVDQDGRPS